MGATAEVHHHVCPINGGIDRAHGQPSEHIGSRPAGHPVLSCAANDRVLSGFAIDPSSPALPERLSLPATSTKRVLARRPLQTIVEGAPEHTLDAGKAVAGCIATDLNRLQQIDGHAPRGITVVGIIEAGAARQKVGTGAAPKDSLPLPP